MWQFATFHQVYAYNGIVLNTVNLLFGLSVFLPCMKPNFATWASLPHGTSMSSLILSPNDLAMS